MLSPVRPQPDRIATARAAVRRAVSHLAALQGADGAWPGDYSGPMFLLPMYLALCQATGRRPEAHREGMIAYLSRAQNDDGSVGLHVEDERGTMFTTALAYVGLRFLGVAAEDARAARMRRWIEANGSPLGAAPWGKLTLCLLGLYDWRGLHPVSPELWLLPRAAPVHPGKLWCHCRQVYLPMAWLYGRRATAPEDALVRELRQELYSGAWAHIDWSRHKDTAAPTDSYRKPTRTLRAVNRAFDALERGCIPPVRRRALDAILDHIHYEDRVTGFLDIGPVNKVLHGFVHWFDDPNGPAFRRAFEACDAYLWQGHDGTKMQGYESSKLWDSAFAVQAVLAASAPDGGADAAQALLGRAYGYIRDNQILDDVPEAHRYYRHRSRGGWPFSSRAHGWPITDCTAEGLKCALALERRFVPAIPEERLHDAVRLILSWQNDDGGWATYERQRGGAWLEGLNPSQVFGDIMVDTSYVECTSACMQALVAARNRFGGALARKMQAAVDRGARFLRSRQRPDGSFEGSWGVCFTYGTWFGVSGLLAADDARNRQAIARACDFLLSKQSADGSWGEHGDSCRERRYVPAPAGSVVQTAWALSTLVRARHASAGPMARAARFLVERQESDGGWAREPLVGVFNRTCLINYDNYRHYFPLWALAEWCAVG